MTRPTALPHAPATRARTPRLAWRGWTALLLGAAAPLTGCYTTRPVTAPAPGTVVLLDLNDRGRVALGERIGASASRIEGVIRERNDSAYAIRISSVSYLNGQSNRWAGEPFSVPVSVVNTVRQREFSRSRTAALGAGIAAAVLTVILKTSFFGTGGNVVENPPPPPPTS